MKTHLFRAAIMPLSFALLLLALASQCSLPTSSTSTVVPTNPTSPTTPTNPPTPSSGPHYFLYASDLSGQGISAYEIDSATGALTEVPGSPFGTVTNTQGLAADPSGRFLYAVSPGGNSITLFTIDPATGALTEQLPRVDDPGTPVAALVDATGGFLYVANSASQTTTGLNNADSVTSYPIDHSTGTLGPVSRTSVGTATQPMALTLSPSGDYLYVADYGTNNIAIIPRGSDGTLASTPSPPSTVAGGASYPASIGITPDNAFVYAANTGSTTMAGYQVHSGGLNPLSPNTYGPSGLLGFPQGLTLSPSGSYMYVANTTAGNVVGLSINTSDGSLAALNGGQPFDLPAGSISPWALAFDPTGKYLYVVNSGSGDISMFKYDDTSGNLTPIGNNVSTGLQGSQPRGLVAVTTVVP